VKVSFFQVGETNIELLLATSPESPVAKYVEKNGEGIHHIAFEVEDLDSATLLADALISEMSKEGITRSLMRLRDALDFLIVSIMEAISLLKVTYCERALSLCSMI
jgi:4-hydroxyphenylpyruvate dioxygenase-like putative hemolysin